MIDRFRKLFAGLDRAHGRYDLTGERSEKGKVKGKALTLQEPVTDELWEQHLNGQQGLGVVPIMDNGCCWFGVIDIDVYDLDLIDLERKSRELDLPLILLRSKSGGAQMYVFFKEPTSASLIRQSLDSWATQLGHPGVEIFPKQEELAGKEDVGNWINMPYFKAEDTERYAIINGKEYKDPIKFLNYAEKHRITQEQLEKIAEQSTSTSEGAPPCLVTLFQTGFPEGSFNNALFNCAVYAQKRWPDDWEDKVLDFNEQHFRGNPKEIKNIIRSIGRKGYFYQCDQPPIVDVCNKKACAKARYGVAEAGPDSPGVVVESLSKILSDPPIWILQIEGRRIRMDTDELQQQSKFAKRCIEALNKFPAPIKPNKWQRFVSNLLAEAREIEAPPEAGIQGQFLHYLEQFCVTKAAANTRDELLIGKPWHNEENGRTYFRLQDLMTYLDQQRFKELRLNQVAAILRSEVEDIDHHEYSLKGRFTNCWSLPSFNKQTEEFEVPRDKEEF